MSKKPKKTENALEIFSEPTKQWFNETFDEPTQVQKEAWPAIMEGHSVLLSAPTGTGKTLSAFLVFIDKLKAMARAGELEDKLYLIYISPLKSLAADIRENLKRPLEGIGKKESQLFGKQTEINIAIRTGDTPQNERAKMIRRPPHILIITPESLYLMLTGKLSQGILHSVTAVIIDELHALIDTKRGAHLMFSVARLEMMKKESPLQRIGLSATIRPLDLAAEYLAPKMDSRKLSAVIVSPAMEKNIKIEIKGTIPLKGRRKDPVWEEMAKLVLKQCQGSRSVIAFTEARRYAEKLAYHVNELGGDGFARVHHGSLSKEQRLQTEVNLRNGSLRLLCATSSMELGIDVGEIDQVLQIGCPRTVSGTMQRLGRAGHNPGRTSYMYMYPRTAPEGLYCGMTAEIARRGGVELANPPLKCFDILAQHLVSMSTFGYHVDEIMELLKYTYSFRDVTKQDVKDILCMLHGDHEHRREIPVRPRLLYDRINEQVSGDNYSRMLAVAAGGTIPDKGLFALRNTEGVHLGELDEEFVYEVRIGEKFIFGSFAWRVNQVKNDAVIVEPASIEGAKLPFWKGEIKGRSFLTSLEFGKMFTDFARGISEKTILGDLANLGLNEAAAESAADFLKRQISATGILPDDKTIIVEHFTDHTGSHQLMVHAMFGRQINTPLALLMQYAAEKAVHASIGCVDEEDGFLLYPLGEEVLPEGLLYAIPFKEARKILEAMLPVTPAFNMTFRYNAGRSLMMGMKSAGRQPLWLQRIKSADLLDSLRIESADGRGTFTDPNHPLIRETRRECLEDLWNIDAVLRILGDIKSGEIAVHEVYTDIPSPMSLPLQWAVEGAEMYSYFPTTNGVRQAVETELNIIDAMKPAPEELERQMTRKKYPENAEQLHTLLMIEGDLLSEELRDICRRERNMDMNMTQVSYPDEELSANLWVNQLAERGLITYIEPGLWIAAEHINEYAEALDINDEEENQLTALGNIIRRMLYYRGAMNAGQISERYFLALYLVEKALADLNEAGKVVSDGDIFYHSKRYKVAQKATIFGLRAAAVTRPAEAYQAMMAARVEKNAPPAEQLKLTLSQYAGTSFPAAWWEAVILPRRVKGYRENMLDQLLAEGEYFWRFEPGGLICFERYEQVNWEKMEINNIPSLSHDEALLYQELKKRGASFMQAFNSLALEQAAQDGLLSLLEKGLVCADSFLPVRQWLNRDKLKKAPPRARAKTRMMSLSTGRWDILRQQNEKKLEDWLLTLFAQKVILCRETYAPLNNPEEDERKDANPPPASSWGQALSILRIWEYIGTVRRGYFVAGMSGAQFVLSEEYDRIMASLSQFGQTEKIVWLNAVDPLQVWGKALKGKDFINVQGTAVALLNGVPQVVLERQGKTLKLLNSQPIPLAKIMAELILLMKQKKIFPDKKRLVIKEYPPWAGQILKEAGFHKEMLDYVWYA
ncbi:MAG: DEAD/DEAH box helicase [Lachnospiraceae bacterium]|nr:DEAD/DEAH box helicase [Lachnospiraceae bacterium]